jgi:hypothetical protein
VPRSDSATSTQQGITDSPTTRLKDSVGAAIRGDSEASRVVGMTISIQVGMAIIQRHIGGATFHWGWLRLRDNPVRRFTNVSRKAFHMIPNSPTNKTHLRKVFKKSSGLGHEKVVGSFSKFVLIPKGDLIQICCWRR